MADNTKWAVTVHRTGDGPTTTLRIADDAGSALRSTAKDLDVEIDEEGYVTGDPEISRLTVNPAQTRRFTMRSSS